MKRYRVESTARHAIQIFDATSSAQGIRRSGSRELERSHALQGRTTRCFLLLFSNLLSHIQGVEIRIALFISVLIGNCKSTCLWFLHVARRPRFLQGSMRMPRRSILSRTARFLCPPLVVFGFTLIISLLVANGKATGPRSVRIYWLFFLFLDFRIPFRLFKGGFGNDGKGVIVHVTTYTAFGFGKEIGRFFKRVPPSSRRGSTRSFQIFNRQFTCSIREIGLIRRLVVAAPVG